MDSYRHRTQKRTKELGTDSEEKVDPLQRLLEEGAKNAYSRQWHRIERGLRLNRIRLFIEEIATTYEMNKDEKEALFLYLQKALDKKLLNTLKVVQYDPLAQRILSIKGLDMKRHEETGVLVYEWNAKKTRTDTTRKKRKEELPAVSVPSAPPTVLAPPATE